MYKLQVNNFHDTLWYFSSCSFYVCLQKSGHFITAFQVGIAWLQWLPFACGISVPEGLSCPWTTFACIIGIAKEFMAIGCNHSIHVTADMIMLYLKLRNYWPISVGYRHFHIISRQSGLDSFSSISIAYPTALAKWESRSLMSFVITDS